MAAEAGGACPCLIASRRCCGHRRDDTMRLALVVVAVCTPASALTKAPPRQALPAPPKALRQVVATGAMAILATQPIAATAFVCDYAPSSELCANERAASMGGQAGADAAKAVREKFREDNNL